MKRSFASKIVCIVKHEATLSCIILSLKRSSDHAVSSVQKLDHPTMWDDQTMIGKLFCKIFAHHCTKVAQFPDFAYCHIISPPPPVATTSYTPFRVPWRCVHPWSVHVALQPKCSSPMDRHLALPISGSWLPGAARAVDGASLLHGPLRVDRTAEKEKKLNGWTDRGWTQHQGTTF